jgi:hypothetical protein
LGRERYSALGRVFNPAGNGGVEPTDGLQPCRPTAGWGERTDILFEFTEEFHDWWNSLSEEQQEGVAYSVRLLMEFGPALAFPQ